MSVYVCVCACDRLAWLQARKENEDLVQTYHRLATKGVDRERAIKDASELGLGVSSAPVGAKFCSGASFSRCCMCGFQVNRGCW